MRFELTTFFLLRKYTSQIMQCGQYGFTQIRTEALGFKVPCHNQLDDKTDVDFSTIIPS